MERASASNKRAAQKNKKTFPDKLFYKIGEVSRIAKVEPYVLRYWETEFPFLKPRKNKSGQRVYIRKDLEQILAVKGLLYEDKYTIEGVRQKFSSSEGASLKNGARQEGAARAETLDYIKSRLRSILDQLR
jgi:DNA-binding transcriptional MerR regulator